MGSTANNLYLCSTCVVIFLSCVRVAIMLWRYIHRSNRNNGVYMCGGERGLGLRLHAR
jgi:hypothetical protein